MRIPAALSEADAHLGLANRLAAPFAKRVFLAYPLEGRDGPSFQVRRTPDPRTLARDRSRGRGARDLRAADPEARVLLVAGALAGARSLNEIVIEAFGEVGPAILHISGERDYWSLQRRVAATTTA